MIVVLTFMLNVLFWMALCNWHSMYCFMTEFMICLSFKCVFHYIKIKLNVFK